MLFSEQPSFLVVFYAINSLFFLLFIDLYTNCLKCTTSMASVKQLTKDRKDPPRSKGCGHPRLSFDNHSYCPSCRAKNRVSGEVPPDPCSVGNTCNFCDSLSEVQKTKLAATVRPRPNRQDSNRPLSEEVLGDSSGEEGTSSVTVEQERSLLGEEQSSPGFVNPPPVQNVALVPPTPQTTRLNKVESSIESLEGKFDSLSGRIDAFLAAAQAGAAPHRRVPSPKPREEEPMEVGLTTQNAPRSPPPLQAPQDSVLDGGAKKKRKKKKKKHHVSSDHDGSDHDLAAPSGLDALPSQPSPTRSKRRDMEHRQEEVRAGNPLPSPAPRRVGNPSLLGSPSPRGRDMDSEREGSCSWDRGPSSTCARAASPCSESQTSACGKSAQPDDEDPILAKEFAWDMEHFRSILNISDPGDKVPEKRTSGLGLSDKVFSIERKQRGPSSMLPMDEVLANGIELWHESFRRFSQKESEVPRPPVSQRRKYHVADSPMELFLQQENTEFSKLKKKDPIKNPHARIPLNRIKDLESCTRENLAYLNYSCHFSRVLSDTLERSSNTWDKILRKTKRWLSDPDQIKQITDYRDSLIGFSRDQMKAVTHLSKVQELLLRSNLHCVGLATLWRREATLANLTPGLDANRRAQLRNCSFLSPQLFSPSLISECEDYLLKRQLLWKEISPLP